MVPVLHATAGTPHRVSLRGFERSRARAAWREKEDPDREYPDQTTRTSPQTHSPARHRGAPAPRVAAARSACCTVLGSARLCAGCARRLGVSSHPIALASRVPLSLMLESRVSKKINDQQNVNELG